jgi:uncharacterized protein (TIGR02679 family)
VTTHMTGSGEQFERLRRLLGGPDTTWLIERLRARIALGRPLKGTVTLTAANASQRRAIESLLGRAPGTGHTLSVRLSELDALLRDAGLCDDGLAGAVRALTGPVPDTHAEAQAARAAWDQAYLPLRQLAGRRPELAAWAAEAEKSGLVKRLSRNDPGAARELTGYAAAVLELLPADGVALPVLSARTFGDAHALDHGRALSSLVLGAVRTLAGLPSAATATAEGRRQAWSAVGVATDELSSRVLTLSVAAELPGEPAVLTLRRIRRHPPAFPGGPVFVCENPAVAAAAADELGERCPPLVCVEGQLSAAARALLTHLVGLGAHLAYHGDFDWGGIRIAAGVLAMPHARPWRYDARHYLSAVRGGFGSPLTTGTPLDTPWDTTLRKEIERHAVRVEEEHLIPELLADLAQGKPRG